MTKGLLLRLVVPVLVVLHFLLHVGFSIERGAPDLLTLALLLAARETGMGLAGGFGFVLGLLEDAFSVLAFGASTLAMTLVGVLGARTRDFFVGDSLLFFFVYLAAGKLLRDLVYWAVAGETIRGPFVGSVLVDGVIAGIYLAVVGVIIVRILGGPRVLR